MIMVINKDGCRLCQDWKWRSFTHFGTYPECIKVYKHAGSAVRTAAKMGGRVVSVTSDETVERSVEAGGVVIEKRPVPGHPGVETCKAVPIHNFVI